MLKGSNAFTFPVKYLCCRQVDMHRWSKGEIVSTDPTHKWWLMSAEAQEALESRIYGLGSGNQEEEWGVQWLKQRQPRENKTAL